MFGLVGRVAGAGEQAAERVGAVAGDPVRGVARVGEVDHADRVAEAAMQEVDPAGAAFAAGGVPVEGDQHRPS